MRTLTLVGKEMARRKARLFACFLGIALGVALLVGVDSLSRSARRAVKRHLEALGANIIVIPNDLSLLDFYRGEFGAALLAEKNVDLIDDAGLSQVRKLAPRLSRRLPIEGRSVMLTGVVPQRELRHAEALATLGDGRVALGSDVARRLAKEPGDSLTIAHRTFVVARVLGQTGGPDDIRVFAPLGVAQDLLQTGRAINEIDLIVAAAAADDALAGRLGRLLPHARVIHVEAIAKAQATAITTLRAYALALLAVVLLAGGAGIANHMVIDVRERRTEIGTLLAIGATPRTVLWLFVAKALIVGLAAGLAGYLVGACLSVALGPMLVRGSVWPSVGSLGWSVLVAVVLAVVFSILPARAAARIDPARVMQEE